MKRAARIFVSAILVGFLLWHADWPTLGSYLSSLNPQLTTISVLLLAAQYPIGAWKWQKSLEMHGISISYKYLLAITCYGFFFNNFLPTAIGGDAYRAYKTIRPDTGKFAPISAVFFDRVVGLLCLTVIGAICGIWAVIHGVIYIPRVLFTVIVSTLTLAFVAALVFRQKLVRLLYLILERSKKFTPVLENLGQFRRNSHAFQELVVVSFLSQTIAVFAVAVLFSALKVPFPFAQSGFAVAAAAFGSIIPLSVNGIGLVEGFFVLAAVKVSLPFQMALIVAVFLRGFMILSSIFFGILYALDPRDDKTISSRARSGN